MCCCISHLVERNKNILSSGSLIELIRVQEYRIRSSRRRSVIPLLQEIKLKHYLIDWHRQRLKGFPAVKGAFVVRHPHQLGCHFSNTNDVIVGLLAPEEQAITVRAEATEVFLEEV